MSLSEIKKIIPNRFKTKINKIRIPINYIKYRINLKKYKQICKRANIKFYTDVDTVNKIIEEKKSLARIGDGELLWTLNRNFESYQNSSPELAESLKNVFRNDNENLLVGISGLYNPNNLSSYLWKVRMHWVNFICKNINDDIFELLNCREKYVDAMISRCYIDYKDKNFSRERYANLKRIWNNKEIVIVEGEMTRIGVGNDLLDNALKVERIICPSKNAYAKYDEIMKEIIHLCKNKLILLALGPTATVLASDVSKLNVTGESVEYQAIDLGHIDIEYEWFLRKVKKRVPIKRKICQRSKIKR